MSNTPHQLIADFPEFADAIAARKLDDARFSSVLNDYNLVNEQVHMAESDMQPMEDLALNALRKTRMSLKDELYRMLTEPAY